MLNRAYTTLKEVDIDALGRLDYSSKQEFGNLLEKASELINELRDI